MSNLIRLGVKWNCSGKSEDHFNKSYIKFVKLAGKVMGLPYIEEDSTSCIKCTGVEDGSGLQIDSL